MTVILVPKEKGKRKKREREKTDLWQSEIKEQNIHECFVIAKIYFQNDRQDKASSNIDIHSAALTKSELFFGRGF